MCEYDVLGFHTRGDLAAFQTCIREPVVGAQFLDRNRIKVGDRELFADVFPIGVDVDEIQCLSTQAQDLRQVKNMVRSLAGRELIIGVDRLDYSKGLTQRMVAYERLLEKYPNARSNFTLMQIDFTLMQIAPPTRKGVRAYDEFQAELEQVSGRINGRFAETDWVPIRHLHKSVSRKPLMGFFRNASVGLVTPVRDGMNLVAKEYVAAQDPENLGMLVLSSLAGAACELTDAVIVNPHDRDDVADGIAAAVSMPLKERRERNTAMMEILRRNDITAWRTRFVNALIAKCE